MEAYAMNLLKLVFMCLVVLVNSEGEYKFIYKRQPANFPNYDNDQYMQLLKNVTFPKRQTEIPVEKENCDSDDIDRLCCAVTKNIRPFALKSMKDKNAQPLWVYQSKYFEQYIPETRCKYEGNACFSDFTETLMAWDLKPKCKTDRGMIQLLVNDHDSTDLRWVTVPIDVSCSCHLTKIKTS
ncbi:hypothetical protein NE865_01378 [Phthorimaea operculella]|nr:hypothetical protein NE865_01378 [Phthorimaea operculella]